MSYGRTDDRAPYKAKVRDASWACRGVVFSGAIPYCSGGETDGILLPSFERDVIYGRDGKRGFREAIERGFIHRAGELCERCLAALRDARTEPPAAGWYLHDYLEHNPSKGEIHSRRRGAKERQDRHRHKRAQDVLPWDGEGSSSRVTNAPVTSRSGVGSTSNENKEAVDARARATDDPQLERVLDILAGCPRFHVDEVAAPIAVANAIAAAGHGKDIVAAAHEAVARGADPAYRTTAPAQVLIQCLRSQPERSTADHSQRRAEALRELMDEAG